MSFDLYIDWARVFVRSLFNRKEGAMPKGKKAKKAKSKKKKSGKRKSPVAYTAPTAIA